MIPELINQDQSPKITKDIESDLERLVIQLNNNLKKHRQKQKLRLLRARSEKR